jgi:hypothetical protein
MLSALSPLSTSTSTSTPPCFWWWNHPGDASSTCSLTRAAMPYPLSVSLTLSVFVSPARTRTLTHASAPGATDPLRHAVPGAPSGSTPAAPRTPSHTRPASSCQRAPPCTRLLRTRGGRHTSVQTRRMNRVLVQWPAQRTEACSHHSSIYNGRHSLH